MIPFEHAAPAVPHLLGYSFFLTKIGGYLFYKPNKEIAPPPSAAVVIPVFNEDPSLFTECLDQILNQLHPPEEIYVVDDASADTTCYDIASRKALAEPRLTVHRFDHNRGKRAIHQWVVQRSNADILVNVDSDVLIQTSGLHEALRPFSNERIQGVSTRATALNHDDNWLTRYLSNILISQDFDRAALSFFDSAYAAGRFSLFRIDLFRKYENEYINETFLGKPIRSGDDACMVRLALRHGRVIYQETSSARTLVANRIGTSCANFSDGSVIHCGQI